MKTRPEIVQKMIRVLACPNGTVQAKVAFFRLKGATDEEITVALNTATDGVLVA